MTESQLQGLKHITILTMQITTVYLKYNDNAVCSDLHKFIGESLCGSILNKTNNIVPDGK